MGEITNKVGEMSINNFGSKMIIVEFNKWNDVLVKFIETDNLVKSQYHAFKIGNVKNPYDKSIYNIAYIGEGEYKSKVNEKRTRQYYTWSDMLKRCYSTKRHEIQPTYKVCSVTDEWHNFQNFGKWYDANYYQIDDERMCLDKDILVKGNKVYSPGTCVFVPQRINSLFVKANAIRGDLPIGVSWHKRDKVYSSTCSDGKGKAKYLGYFSTAEEAFAAYKLHKENYIKQVAEEYKDNIPNKLYSAMINYIIDIDD